MSHDHAITATEKDQSILEEQTYRETMRGIPSFMGWSHNPDMDSSTNPSDDNLFTGPKTQVLGKMSVQLPIEDWLCRKLNKLNTTLVEGYPSCSSEVGGLLKQSHKPSGTGCFPTIKLTLLLSPLGIQTLQS